MFNYFPSSRDFFSSADNLCKQFEDKSGPDLDPNCPEKYYEEVKIEKKTFGRQKQSMQNYHACQELMNYFMQVYPTLGESSKFPKS